MKISAIGLLGGGLWFINGAANPVAGLIMIVAAGILFLLFGSMTVRVDHEVLQFHLGRGLLRKRIPLTNLRSWQPIESHWLHGYGIRRYAGGWMYRVSGQQAVELHLLNGGQLRLGTDEPETLCAVLSAAVPQAKPPVHNP
ncbi:MAG: hypothetical protein CMH55_09860 [Myxococcales bacterium]|nr:hypothetical protein [Myxococcales bacterium]